MTIEMYIWRVVEDHFQSSMRIHLGHKKHICIRRWRPVATMRCSRMRVLCSKSLPVLPSNWFSVLRWKKIPWDTLQGTGAPHNCFKEALAAASLWRGIAAAATTPWERRKAATTRNRVLNAEAPFRSTAKATATVPPIVGSGKGGGGRIKGKRRPGPKPHLQEQIWRSRRATRAFSRRPPGAPPHAGPAAPENSKGAPATAEGEMGSSKAFPACGAPLP